MTETTTRVPDAVPRAQTVSYFLCFGLVGVLSTLLGPSLITFATSTGSSLSGLGVLFTVDAFGSVCGSLLAGHLLNRFAPHRQAALGLAGITVITAVIPLLTQLPLLLPAWWFLGMSKTFLIVTVNTLLVWVRRGRVGPYMSAADFFLGLGSLLMPIVIAQSIAWTGGLHWGYWAVTAGTVVLMIRLAALPSPRMAGAEEQSHAGSIAYPVVISVAVLLFFYVGAEISFSGWIPSYTLTRGIADSAAAAAYYSSLFWIAVTAGRLLWLPFTRTVAPERLLATGVTACVLALGSIWLLPSSSGCVIAGTVAFGLAMSPIFPSAFTLLDRRGQITGKVSAVCLCTASVGAMFFPWWIGQFLMATGESANGR
ncbi:MAG TPA: MFS transporter [Actinophytocola sp.]|uniref:MFS transporter n=1 Tax=Actinophytocola sp. TaxID=1872138 RepID=UPI002E049402|nr:MFS transporter [Actinophytocola sp.]